MKYFITSASYEPHDDSIEVIVSDEKQTKIATVKISFPAPRSSHTWQNVSHIETTFSAEDYNIPCQNSAVLAARVICALDDLTTAETDIALVPDFDEPIELKL